MLKVLALISLFVSACSFFAPATIQSKRATDLESRKIRRIAVVLPDGKVPEPRAQATYTSTPVEKGRSEEELAELLARLVYSAMASMPDWQIISESEVREVSQSIPPGAAAERLRRLGEMVYADALIVGRMQRYRERIGNEWGAKSPASVAFVLDLIDTRRGDIVWSARFDETQKPLTENIFALGNIGDRGVRWLSAEQLTQEGVRRAVSQLHELLGRPVTS
jgi:hypothetical protein